MKRAAFVVLVIGNLLLLFLARHAMRPPEAAPPPAAQISDAQAPPPVLNPTHWAEIGVDTHFFRVSDAEYAEKSLSLFKSAGGTWMRETFPWVHIEPAKGHFDWTGSDRVVRLARKHGLKLLVTLAYCPQWAQARPGSPRC